MVVFSSLVLSVCSMSSIIAKAYPANAQTYVLYTYAPAAAPDVTSITKQVYKNSTDNSFIFTCDIYNGVSTTVKGSIPTAIVDSNDTHERTFTNAPSTKTIQLKSSWTNYNTDGNYVNCNCYLPTPNLDSNFYCVMYAY